MRKFILGLDLAQAVDFTALVVVEIIGTDPSQWTYRVIRTERWEKHTPYPIIAEAIKARMEKEPLAPYKTGLWVSADGTHSADVWEYPSVLVVDAGGPGRPVIDSLRRHKLLPVPVATHGGEKSKRADDGRGWSASQTHMVQTLTGVRDEHRLQVHRGVTEAATLMEEMQAYISKQNAATGHVSFGNDARVSAHDDIFVSVMLAVWYGEFVKEWSGQRRRTVPLVERITLV